MSLSRVACLAYLALLSFLLLADDPLGLLGIPRPPGPPGGRTFHFLLFALLAILVHASRWPVRQSLLAGIMVAYAVGTELLQALQPHRKVELLDLLENLTGLGAGTVVWWWIRRKAAGSGSSQEPTTAGPSRGRAAEGEKPGRGGPRSPQD